MAITINGSGTITGVSAGGLPDGSVTNDDLATGISSSKLSGALPALDGSALTGVDGGLVRIGRWTFPSANSISFDNVFTSDYKDYKVIISGCHPVNNNNNLYMNLRNSGSDITGSSYRWLAQGGQNSGGSPNSTESRAGWNDNKSILHPSGSNLGSGQNTPTCGHLTFFDPLSAHSSPTTVPMVSGNFFQLRYDALTFNECNFSMMYNAYQTYDGFTLHLSSGSFKNTGSITIYGYN